MWNWIRAFIIARLTQLTSWIGVALIFMAFLAPRSFFIDLGIILIVLNDQRLSDALAKIAPSITKKLNEWQR